MNFVADESVDRQIVERLCDDGHFVMNVHPKFLNGNQRRTHESGYRLCAGCVISV